MTYSKNNWQSNPDKRTRYALENIEDGVADVHDTLQYATCVNGEFRWGNTTGDYTAIEPDGTIEFNGAAMVWEDLRFDGNSLKAAGVKDPAYSTVIGTMRSYTFSPTTQEELYFAVQFPHGWSREAVYPHVHWFASTASTNVGCRWGLEYTWANIGSTLSSPATVYGSTVYPETTVIEKNKHYITSFAAITPSTNQDSFSSMMLCRLFRDSTVAADTFDQFANLLEFDIHYSVKKMGTRQELSDT